MSPQTFKRLATLSMFTVLLWPLMMMHGERYTTSTARALMLAMPLFIIASGWLAIKAHNERPEVAWVLLALLWLSVIAMLSLAWL